MRSGLYFFNFPRLQPCLNFSNLYEILTRLPNLLPSPIQHRLTPSHLINGCQRTSKEEKSFYSPVLRPNPTVHNNFYLHTATFIEFPIYLVVDCCFHDDKTSWRYVLDDGDYYAI